MQKWEYKAVRLSAYPGDADVLNQLGQEGWELVSVASDTLGDAYDTKSLFMAYLKRPRE
jgi:hypothetical protein